MMIVKGTTEQMLKSIGLLFLAALLVTGLLLSCASAPGGGAGESRGGTQSSGGGTSSGGGAAAPGVPRYYGMGTAASMTGALNEAKMAAVKAAVEEMIGKAAAAAKASVLEDSLYGVKNANVYVKNETLEILNKQGGGEKWLVEIAVEANLEAIEKTLRANGIFGGKITPGSPLGSGAVGAKGSDIPAGGRMTSVAEAEAEKEEEAALKDKQEEEYQEALKEASPEEREFIDQYVENMTYMVYFDEDTVEDSFLMKAAVTMANSYLAERAKSLIDMDQIEKIKKDQELVYEEQTGQAVGIIQWIARKLNADVYIEIDAGTSGRQEGNKYYGQANITLKLFDASTGKLLGSVPYSSPRTVSNASIDDAVNNALQSSIYKALPMALNQSEVYMKRALARGLQYDLVVQNTPDPKLMSTFRRKLKNRVKFLRTLSSSDRETLFEVRFLGSITDLEDMVYTIAESIPGLEGMERVYFRGKSITFDTGL
jgi:hypothetical protein